VFHGIRPALFFSTHREISRAYLFLQSLTFQLLKLHTK
jgi:hypothetical protein